MVNIRRATLTDLPEVARLFNLYRVFYRKASDPEGAQKFLAERMSIGDSVIFVAEAGDCLVGFAQLYPLFSSVRIRKMWLLNDLFVLPESRGLGISKQLLSAAKNLSVDTNAAGILLETGKTNEIGNRLYPSADFKAYDETNFYWWENS